MLTTLSTLDQTLSQANHSRDAVAKLMATENIHIVHCPSATTATFNTESRVLTLPIFKNMTAELYDMFIGHEVGHALWTPTTATEIVDAMKRIDPRRPLYSKMLLNVCEDVRIEKFIKNKYPGLGRSFSKGYQWMMDKDFFQINGKDVNTLPLVDRVNLYFKPGLYGHVQVKFNAQEQVVVNQIAAANTWTTMVDAAKALYDLAEKQAEEQPQAQQPQPQQGGKSGNGTPIEGGSQQQEGSGSGSGEGQDSEGNNPSSGNGSGGNNPNGQDKNDGKSAGNGGNNKSSGGGTFNQDGNSTQEAMEKALQKMVSDSGVEMRNLTMPEQDLSNIVYGFKEIMRDFKANETAFVSSCVANKVDPIDQRGGMTPDQRLSIFTRENRGAILTMVRRFEMKMNADVSRRTSESRSGTINMGKIHSYKLIDDIFLSNSEVAAGKNHGVVFYIDWSSSMSNNLDSTVKQLLNMTEFCRTLSIPFDVYAFTTNNVAITQNKDKLKSTESRYGSCKKLMYPNSNDNNLSLSDSFGLLHWLSSSMGRNEYRTAAGNMLELSSYISNKMKAPMGGSHHGRYGASIYSNNANDNLRHLMLDGTPLDNAAASAFKIVPMFKAKHNLQVVTFCILTDGESSGDCLDRKSAYTSTQGYRYGQAILTVNNRRFATAATERSHSIPSWHFLIEVLKNAYGINTMGMYLSDMTPRRLNEYTSNLFESCKLTKVDIATATSNANKEFTSEGFVLLPHAGFDKWLLIQASTEIVNTTEMLNDVRAGDAKGAAKAFSKGMTKSLVSRNLLTIIADTCSTSVGL